MLKMDIINKLYEMLGAIPFQGIDEVKNDENYKQDHIKYIMGIYNKLNDEQKNTANARLIKLVRHVNPDSTERPFDAIIAFLKSNTGGAWGIDTVKIPIIIGLKVVRA